MKIWILSVDDDCATWAKAFSDRDSAEAYFKETVADYWERFLCDEEMPEDAHEAWSRIRDETGCVDTISIDEDEFVLPPVYEAGPELLECLKEALEVMGDWGPEGEPGWATRTRQIVNKAEGK